MSEFSEDKFRKLFQLENSLTYPQPGSMDAGNPKRDRELIDQAEDIIHSLLQSIRRAKVSGEIDRDKFPDKPVEGWEFWVGSKSAGIIDSILQ